MHMVVDGAPVARACNSQRHGTSAPVCCNPTIWTPRPLPPPLHPTPPPCRPNRTPPPPHPAPFLRCMHAPGGAAGGAAGRSPGGGDGGGWGWRGTLHPGMPPLAAQGADLRWLAGTACFIRERARSLSCSRNAGSAGLSAGAGWCPNRAVNAINTSYTSLKPNIT